MNGGRLSGLLIIVATMIAADAPDANRPARSDPFLIRWNRSEANVVTSVDVVGIDAANLARLSKWSPGQAEWKEFFAVTVEPPITGKKEEPPPILGSYRILEGILRFQPKFPFEPGLRLQARFRPSQLPTPKSTSPADITSRITLAETTQAGPPSKVVRVAPSADQLPENLLKFYLHFSRPMARGEAYQRVRILDEAGQPLERPFLEIGEELWDPSGQRLTLLLDPGRIKQGLRPRLEEGPILQAGRAYTLVVDRAWPDISGRPLAEGFRKAFRAGPMDEGQPDPKTWTIKAPSPNTREPLVVQFPEALDRAMLEHVLSVHDSQDAAVPGKVLIEENETRWCLLPEQPWAPGTYTLSAVTTLEDLAGNSIARPFEVDVLRPVERAGILTETTSRTFVIRKPEPQETSGQSSEKGKNLGSDSEAKSRKNRH